MGSERYRGPDTQQAQPDHFHPDLGVREEQNLMSLVEKAALRAARIAVAEATSGRAVNENVYPRPQQWTVVDVMPAPLPPLPRYKSPMGGFKLKHPERRQWLSSRQSDRLR